MLVAKAKEQEEELCRLSQLQAHCLELQEQTEAAKTASLEYQQETQVQYVCMYVYTYPAWSHTHILCTYICIYVHTYP